MRIYDHMPDMAYLICLDMFGYVDLTIWILYGIMIAPLKMRHIPLSSILLHITPNLKYISKI
jgi:hypothetical protein